jgi:hypothetical protein
MVGRGTWGMHCGVNLGVDVAAQAQWVWVVGVKSRTGCCSNKALQEPRPARGGCLGFESNRGA